tara:strand:- start:204 stop:452 length:249 start_codon:yes stop_codon:yes gene_type:complete
MSLNDPSVAHEKSAIMKYVLTSPGSYLGERKEDNYIDRLQKMTENLQPEGNYHLLPSVSYRTKIDLNNNYHSNSSSKGNCYR